MNLDIISINIYSIIISLANLLILFFILKKFLFKPVKKMLAERKNEIDNQYKKAEETEKIAHDSKVQWEKKLKDADIEADQIIKAAEVNANRKKESIISDANTKAENIIRRAQEDADAERIKAQEEIKKEIVDVSSVLAGKILEREINMEDHKKIIDSFLADVEDNNG